MREIKIYFFGKGLRGKRERETKSVFKNYMGGVVFADQVVTEPRSLRAFPSDVL